MTLLLSPKETNSGVRSGRAGSVRYDSGVESRADTLTEDLVSGFLAGDEKALKELYDATSRLVYSFCRRTVGPDTAADVTQEVYLAAWRSRHRYRPQSGTLTGWLMGIARFKAIDALRSAGRRPHLDDEGEPEDLGAPSDDIEQVAQRMLVADALDRLSERPRRVVEMAFFDNLTHSEVAESTGIPLGTVKSDIRRGLAVLKDHLEGFDAGRP